MRLDSLDQVGGHALAEPVAADEHRHASRLVREVQDGLAGGVPRPDDHDVLAGALSCLAAAGAVVDAVADQVVEAVQVEPGPVHARGRQDDRGCHFGAVLEDQPDRLVVPVHPAAADAAHEHQLRAEPFCLAGRQPRELGPADPVRKAEEVLDHRRVGRLAAGHIVVADERREAVRSGVDRGGQTCRPGADDDEVVVLLLRRQERTPRSGDRLDRRCLVALLAVDEDREGGLREPEAFEQALGVGRARLVPVVGLGRAREEVAQPVVLGVHPPADDLHRWPDRTHSAMVLPLEEGDGGRLSVGLPPRAAPPRRPSRPRPTAYRSLSLCPLFRPPAQDRRVS